MNFNGFKYQQKIFVLEVGDIFRVHADGNVYYEPKGHDNQRQIPQSGEGFHWYRDKSMKLPNKYYKIFNECENKEMVDMDVYEITHVDPVHVPEPTQKIYYVGIKHPEQLKPGDELFTIRDGLVKKETEKQFSMAKSFNYNSRILKSEFEVIKARARFGNNIVRYGDQYAVLCRFKDLDHYLYSLL